ncbi:Linear gramicidin synthase subunit D [Planctomycetes bacterium Poly30]|uniref:Linear gramicidin synthase subunit D n=1 Tax=Saltatorellus ferox TaxID=2528018 RepID=A0A518F194_9BACT|nr:Linear gramicidin synthase subunit D [Planctomycetes bacterium Poly30]
MASAPNVESVYRLTSTQEGILFHAVQDEASGLYLQQFTAVLVGELDVERFRRAWDDTVARHPALRALFTWKKRPHPLQVVRRTVELPLEIREDAALLEEGRALHLFLEVDRRRGLALEAAPVMRLTLVPGGGHRHRLVWTFHHIALDGWSMRVVLREVFQRYEGTPPEAPAPSHETFVDWLATRSDEDALAFWRAHLSGFDEPTRLAVAAPRDSVRSAQSHAEHTLRLSREGTDALVKAARASRVTLNVVLRAAWALTLSRFSGTDDVVFGATVAGRPPEIPGIEEIVGMFIHTVPVRAKIDWSAPASEWCARLQRDQLDAQPHETTSLAAIQRASEVPQGTPLFETLLVMENHAVAEEAAERSLRVEGARYLERSHYPLALLVVPGEDLELILVRDRWKVSEEVAGELLVFVESVLGRFALRPERPVAELVELPSFERERLVRWSRSGRPAALTAAVDVLERIAAAAHREPEALALRCPGAPLGSVSYRALAGRTQAIAAGLSRLGVKPGDLVGVRLPRGLEAVATILGVMWLGAAYVPIDPEAPEARVAAIASAVPLRMTVGIGGIEPEQLSSAGAGDVPPRHAGGSSLAYVLFTSGTTGAPKGVEITRDALARSTAARDAFYGEEPERFLLLSPLHFDSSVAGLFWTLCTGRALVLPVPGEQRDARRIVQLIRTERVTHTLLLPSLYEVVLETAEGSDLDSLATVIVAGEACSGALVSAHLSGHLGHPRGRARLVNEYGPTEATVWATAMELTRPDAVDPVPIGAPIGEVRTYVLDGRLEPVPTGVSGELYLGGPTLARGYTGDVELSSARFVESAPLDPRGAPERLYRTGDRVRWDEEGRLVFLGRVDRQVKIRGQRIELGEVEAALVALPGVREAVVVAALGPGGQKQLVAFVSGPGAERAEHDAEGLAEKLTGAMRPRAIVALDSFPLTPSGKVDHPALGVRAADVLLEAPAVDASVGRPPTDDVEARLLMIWREVLGIEDIAVDQDFYGLGGDSLTSIRLVARAHKAGIAVELAEFAADPTIEGMARAASVSVKSAASAARSAGAASGRLPLTPVQSWFFALDLPERHHWNQAIRIGGSHDGEPEKVVERLTAALRRLPERHDALRLRFERDGDRWLQRVDSVEEAEGRASVVSVDLRGVPEEQRDALELREANAAHRGFDLKAGRLFGARICVTESGWRLLLVAHHLIVDAVSWSVLVDEIRGDSGVKPVAASRADSIAGASYRDWVEALKARADSQELKAEADYWLGLGRAQEAREATEASDAGSVASERALLSTLEPDLSEALATGIHDAYGTRPREILLAALSRALARWSGTLRHVVDIEGHGREAEAAGAAQLDVSSTVGWLTSVWPLALEEDAAPGPETLGASIRATKERLRAVPGNGLGFGLLAHTTEDPELRRRIAGIGARGLLFNYLGQIGSGDGAGSPMAAIADPQTGSARSTAGRRAYPLELNAWIEDSSLHLRWSFSDECHGAAQIEALNDRFLEELRGLIHHCQDPEAGAFTPSDFPLAGVDQAELDRIARLLGGG